MNITELLRQLNSAHGPAGDEREVAEALRTLAAPFADEITRDTMGNLIFRRKGRGPKVMFAAHMDSIGLIVTHIEPEGFLRFGRLGGLRPHSLLHTTVRFRNGRRGLVSRDEKVDVDKVTLDDLYLDVGAKDRQEAEGMVQVGDTAVYDAPAFEAGGRIVSPHLDNRISCVVMLMAMEALLSAPVEQDLYFVFTAQEELGLRGARTAAYAIDPDYAVAVDVTTTDDALGSKHGGSARLGGGAAIKIMDASVICHPEVTERLSALAAEQGIRVQRDIIKSGGTDAGGIHISRAGVPTGGISVPCRYIHSPVEMVDRSDVEACAALLTAFAAARIEGQATVRTDRV